MKNFKFMNKLTSIFFPDFILVISLIILLSFTMVVVVIDLKLSTLEYIPYFTL